MMDYLPRSTATCWLPSVLVPMQTRRCFFTGQLPHDSIVDDPLPSDIWTLQAFIHRTSCGLSTHRKKEAPVLLAVLLAAMLDLLYVV